MKVIDILFLHVMNWNRKATNKPITFILILIQITSQCIVKCEVRWAQYKSKATKAERLTHVGLMLGITVQTLHHY